MLIREFRVHSQNGEDGIIASIFNDIGTTNRFFIEIGVEDGHECNTRALSDVEGWEGLRIDDHNYNDRWKVHQHTVTPYNVVELLQGYRVPVNPDLFSIDIDGFDFHVLCGVLKMYHPRVIVSEYNSALGPYQDYVEPYEEGKTWDSTNFFGASYKAFEALGEHFGYRIVYCDSTGVNIFLVRKGLTPETDENHFMPPKYGGGVGHPADPLHRQYHRSEEYLTAY